MAFGPARRRLLLGPWHAMLVVLCLPWVAIGASILLVEPEPGESGGVAGRLFVLAMCIGAVGLIAAIGGRAVVSLSPDGVSMGGQVIPFDHLFDVVVRDVDERILPLEAPVLVTESSPTRGNVALPGLMGFRTNGHNSRVMRQANLIRRAAGLPPLRPNDDPPPATPRRAAA